MVSGRSGSVGNLIGMVWYQQCSRAGSSVLFIFLAVLLTSLARICGSEMLTIFLLLQEVSTEDPYEGASEFLTSSEPDSRDREYLEGYNYKDIMRKYGTDEHSLPEFFAERNISLGGSMGVPSWFQLGCVSFIALINCHNRGFLCGPEVGESFRQSLKLLLLRDVDSDFSRSYCAAALAHAYIFTAEFDLVISDHFFGHPDSSLPEIIRDRSFQLWKRGKNLLSSLGWNSPSDPYNNVPSDPYMDAFKALDRSVTLNVSAYVALGVDEWNHIWIPSPQNPLENYWSCSIPDRGVGLLLNSSNVHFWAPHLEQALRYGAIAAFRLMYDAKELGLIDYFWPAKSTAISLLRYGRLFGVFEDPYYHVDCVDDDLDFEVGWVDPSEAAWQRFVTWLMEKFTLEHQFQCCIRAETDNMHIETKFSSLTQLLCVKYIDDFLVHVGIQRRVEALPSDEDAFCSNHEIAAFPVTWGPDGAHRRSCAFYDDLVPCPCWMYDAFARSGSCLAWPDAASRSLYYGNHSFVWLLTDGLSLKDKAQLLDTFHKLEKLGAASLIPYLTHSLECRDDEHLQILVEACMQHCIPYCGCANDAQQPSLA